MTMDLGQLTQMTGWLDEEHRRDKAGQIGSARSGLVDTHFVSPSLKLPSSTCDLEDHT